MTTYTEIPDNYHEIAPLLETNLSRIIPLFFSSEKIYFYDTCSFRRHSNLTQTTMQKLTAYFKSQNAVLIITRCVLMELASSSHTINEEYIRYLSCLSDTGLSLILLDEEYVFDILSECFSTNQMVNEYLIWAVRMLKAPASTISLTLRNQPKLSEEVLAGKNASHSDLYRRFFSAVRNNKEHSDNLGEELIGICIHILSHLPGTADGKFCILTDDKGAAGSIDAFMARTNAQYQGAKIILFSTPKLIQHIYQEHFALTKDDLIEILSQGISGNLSIMSMTSYSLDSQILSMSASELAEKIMEPNGIYVVF